MMCVCTNNKLTKNGKENIEEKNIFKRKKRKSVRAMYIRVFFLYNHGINICRSAFYVAVIICNWMQIKNVFYKLYCHCSYSMFKM